MEYNYEDPITFLNGFYRQPFIAENQTFDSERNINWNVDQTHVAIICGPLEMNVKKKKCIIINGLCVPLGGAGVEGGACPIHGRVVLTYWWSLSKSNFLFT